MLGAAECGCAAGRAPPLPGYRLLHPPAPRGLLFPRWPPNPVLVRREQSQLHTIELSRKQKLYGWLSDCSMSIFIYCYNLTKSVQLCCLDEKNQGSASRCVSHGLSLSVAGLLHSLLLLIRILAFLVKLAQKEV